MLLLMMKMKMMKTMKKMRMWRILMMRGLYLSWEVSAGLEALEESRHGDGGEEENDGPEENIRDVGTMGTTGLPYKHTSLLYALLSKVRGRYVITAHTVIMYSRGLISKFSVLQNQLLEDIIKQDI